MFPPKVTLNFVQESSEISPNNVSLDLVPNINKQKVFRPVLRNSVDLRPFNKKVPEKVNLTDYLAMKLEKSKSNNVSPRENNESGIIGEEDILLDE